MLEEEMRRRSSCRSFDVQASTDKKQRRDEGISSVVRGEDVALVDQYVFVGQYIAINLEAKFERELEKPR